MKIDSSPGHELFEEPTAINTGLLGSESALLVSKLSGVKQSPHALVNEVNIDPALELLTEIIELVKSILCESRSMYRGIDTARPNGSCFS